ncbi:MAG: amidohydrolase, partial [Mycobacteriaceae bacterium]
MTTSTSAANALLSDLEEVRTWQEPFYQHLHQHPELSHREVQTAAAVAQRLRDAGLEVTDHVGGT